MAKRFRPCSLDQPYLLPPFLSDWLPEDHLARVIADLVGELDLRAILQVYERNECRGPRAYDPVMLTRLLLYAYAVGQPSSRQIERATYDSIPYRYLAVNQHPDHDTIAHFRQRHLAALADLFVQALRLCREAGLVRLGHVAIDGTKIKASAARRRSVSYERLSEREQYWQKKVEELLAQAAATDAAETAQAAAQKADPALPPDLAHAQTRLAAIRAARQKLADQAQRKLAEARAAHPGADRPPGRPRASEPSRTPADPVGCEKRKKAYSRAKKNAEAPAATYNFTDPDSDIMVDGATKAKVQAYNAQAAVDGHAQIIVAAEITQDINDKGQLTPMLAAVAASVGQKPGWVTADTGYWDTESIRQAQADGYCVLVPPESQPDQGLTSSSPRNETATAMRERLASEEGKAQYRQRQSTVEPVFGQTKQARGFRPFALRGKEKVSAEWKLICLTGNLLKLGRHRLKVRREHVQSGAKSRLRRYGRATRRRRGCRPLLAGSLMPHVSIRGRAVWAC